MNWTELPDLAAVGLLAGAFASVARRNQTHVSKIWLTGWLMIAMHFAAFLFLNAPGVWGLLSQIVGLSALTWTGLLFMWASVPYRQENSSRSILISLILANTIYLALSTAASTPNSVLSAPGWALNLSASLFAILPVGIALSSKNRFGSPLRWALIGLYCALSVFILLIQHRPDSGLDYAQNAVLFTVYIGCCIHFWYAFRRATAGAFITISGFLAWAAVFVVAPLMAAYFPSVQVEGEVWNLPKYVVAVGMILLLLEDQIEHNQHLALHDHLTGLPNRRLYQDRLASALERARRTEQQAALLVIDLDRFKQVNDTLGHHIGDLVLQKVGEMFASRVRRYDTVARTGGDEFSVILEEPTSRADAALVGQSLVELLNEPLKCGEHTVHIGASVGIAVFPEDAPEMESLCIAADLRMYDAKHDSLGDNDRGHVRSAHSLRSVDAAKSIDRLNPQTQSGLQVAE